MCGPPGWSARSRPSSARRTEASKAAGVVGSIGALIVASPYYRTIMTTLPTTESLRGRTLAALRRCGAQSELNDNGTIPARTPITGGEFGRLVGHSPGDVVEAVGRAEHAFAGWRDTPAPVRGGLVRRLGELLR